MRVIIIIGGISGDLAGTFDIQPDRRHHLFMNDDLTKTRAQLLYRCRVQKKDTKIADCWSSDGTILVKTLDHKITAVKSEADLASVCMQTVH